MDKAIITEQSISQVHHPRIEFDKPSFEDAVWSKGYNVYIESTIKCPCRGKSSSNLATCQNCLGTGYVYLDRYDTRMLVHSINVNTKYKEWSEEKIGTASVTALARDYFSFMDRITIKDSMAIQSEIAFVKNTSTQSYIFTIYDPLSIDYMFIYAGDTVKLTKLVLNTDYTIDRNKIIFTSIYQDDIAVSIRYKCNLQYHVIDVPHDVRNSPVTGNTGSLENTLFPVQAIVRRSHYVIDALNFVGDNIIYNS